MVFSGGKKARKWSWAGWRGGQLWSAWGNSGPGPRSATRQEYGRGGWLGQQRKKVNFPKKKKKKEG